MSLPPASDTDELLPTRRTLLSRLKDTGDQQGWQEFFDTYWRLIYGIARKAGLTDAEAKDALQETVITVSKHIGDFKYDPAKCSFKTWLLLLTRQRIARQFAKRAGSHSLVTSTPASEGETRTTAIERIPDPVEDELEALWNVEWEKHALAIALERVKKQVKPEHFQMFDLYVLQHWPVHEVARVLQVSVGQVYLTKHRVGRLLKKEVAKLEKQSR